MPTFTLSQLAHWMHLPVHDPLSISGVCVDSRLIKPGELFFALKGLNNDGHDFLQEVAAKGAPAAVVSRSFSGNITGIKLIPVDDVLQSLQEATKSLLIERHPRLVAVTGSLGKTTTIGFCSTLLAQKYRVAASPGNSNPQIDIPLAVLNYTSGDEEVLVLEMGMSPSENLQRLVQIAPPDIAVITTAEIGGGQGEIFSHPKTQWGILDRHIENCDEIAQVGCCRKIFFSTKDGEADYTAQVSDGHLIVTTPGGVERLTALPFLGRHHVHNFLAAAIVAHSLGVTWEEIDAAIPNLELPERRLQIIQKHGALFLNDSYNATMLSLKADLECMPAPKPGGKKIAVIGEMLELGKFTEPYHREVGSYALQHVDVMLCYGAACKSISETWQAAGRTVEWHMERSGVVESLRKILHEGDVVLLKGSRANAASRVLDEL